VLKRAVRVGIWTVVGGLFGFGMSSIPSPHAVSMFWVGNFCAPWLVLSFFAGRAQGSPSRATLAGVLTDTACVVGFYARALTFDPMRLGLPPVTPFFTIANTSLRSWLAFVAPWIAAAVAGGATYGLLGNWWKRRRSIAAGLAVALPFLAEPVLWPLKNGYYKGPWFIWAAEVVVGLSIAFGVVHRQRATDRQAVRA
jgi:hypothetical protein